MLLPLRWETHAAPEYGTRPQEAINRLIVDPALYSVLEAQVALGSGAGSRFDPITEYDEYLRTSISAQHRRMVALREKHHQSLLVLGARSIERLVHFGGTTHQALLSCSQDGTK